MKEILFSILVPVYNVEKYLKDCVQSVLNQTYSSWELILVDDGSTDASAIIVDDYAKLDSRIKAFHKVNGGQLHTRQYAISKAQGQYCVFLDSDDLLYNNALEVLAEYAKKDYDCIVYGYEKFNRENTIIDTACDHELIEENDVGHNITRLISNSGYNSLCRKSFKLNLLREIKCKYDYSIRQGEDLMQSIDLYFMCKRIIYIPIILYKYRLNTASTSHIQNNLKKQDDIFKVRNYVLKKVLAHDCLSEKDINQVRNYYITTFIYIIFNIAVYTNYNNFVKCIRGYIGSDYYRFIIDADNTDDCGLINNISMTLLKKRMYFLLWLLLKIANARKQLKH